MLPIWRSSRGSPSSPLQIRRRRRRSCSCQPRSRRHPVLSHSSRRSCEKQRREEVRNRRRTARRRRRRKGRRAEEREWRRAGGSRRHSSGLYDLANVVPILAKFYHQASESYEQACSRHINLVIYIHFEKLFQYARKIEELMYNMSPEEIPFQVGMSKVEFRKMLKSSLTSLDKTINAMYRKLQKNITVEELLPSLWEKCKKEFLDKYATFLKLVSKVYPDEKVTSVNEMRDILAAL